MTSIFFGKLLVHCALSTAQPLPNNYSGIEIKSFSRTQEKNLAKEIIPTDTINYISIFMQVASTKSYTQTKTEIQKIKSKIDLNTIEQDSLSKLFTELLVQKIIPYWYGTPWDFNGYTAVPNQGVIACGYFVSTTLLHMGVTINRYKMAQQLPIHEAMTLSLGEPVIEIYNETVEKNIEQIRDTLSEGIYFLGLDGGHVGYILERNDRLYIIHANYIGDGGGGGRKNRRVDGICKLQQILHCRNKYE